ncbi:hypothetical protein HanIR_Chr14g0721691 [Helianthus annuus]|nr:hypothetical protein HanIR_Chr14g0721691 [Helianthus annuus]
MNTNLAVRMLVVMVILLVHTTCTKAIRCPNCGTTPISYPLSTEPTCGHQSYKIRCDSGVLKFDTLNNTYSINQSFQKIRLL